MRKLIITISFSTILLLSSQLSYSKPGDILWTFNAQQMIEAGPAVAADGTLYLGSDDQHIWAVDSKGNKKWAYPLAADMSFSPVIGTDGNIYLDVNDPVSHDATLYAFTPAGTLLWSKMITQDPAHSTSAGLDVGLGPLNIDAQNNLYAVATYWPKGG